jgi:hypothetical protein
MGHPRRKQISRFVGSAEKHMRGTVVLVLAQSDKTLAVKRMKGVVNCDFLGQNPGTMNCLPILVANGPRLSTV